MQYRLNSTHFSLFLTIFSLYLGDDLCFSSISLDIFATFLYYNFTYKRVMFDYIMQFPLVFMIYLKLKIILLILLGSHTQCSISEMKLHEKQNFFSVKYNIRILTWQFCTYKYWIVSTFCSTTLLSSNTCYFFIKDLK